MGVCVGVCVVSSRAISGCTMGRVIELWLSE